MRSSTVTRRQVLGAPAILGMGRRRPNVLWLMTDEQRPDSLGCYRSPWAHSPHLDALAAEGAVFESAYTPSPVCVPCRSALLTGNTASTNGVLHNQARLRTGAKMATWRFEDAGYQTASFGKKHYFLPGARQAFQAEAGRAADEYVDATRYGEGFAPEQFDAVQYTPAASQKEKRTWILAGRFPVEEDRSAEARNVGLAIDWLGKRDPAKPFFLRLSLNAPHTPVVAPPQYLPLIDADRIAIAGPAEDELAGQPARERIHLRGFEGSHPLSAGQLRKARHYYYARVAFLDAMIGRLIGWMKPRGVLENTIVVFLSDHGTHLGDHGLLQKQTFYEQVVTVPYFLSCPGLVRRGARIGTAVNTLSLLPTLLELCGLPHGGLQGPSLASAVLRGAEPAAAPVFSEIAYGYQGYRDADRQVMVRDGRYKLSLFPDGGDPDGALYDLEDDPGETRNLYAGPQHRAVVEKLTRTITAWKGRSA